MLTRNIVSFLLLSASIAAAQTKYGSSKPTASDSQTHPQDSASAGCPWLTQETAARAVGSDVSSTVDISGAVGSCKFSREPGSTDYLEIRVSKAELPACPARSGELRGIGNEAARCITPGVHGHTIEMISSRVRDLYFTVTLSSRAQKNAANSAFAQNDALEQIAEQVAGSLY